MSLIDKNRLNDKLNSNASWFRIHKLEAEKRIHITLDNDIEQIKFVIRKELKDKTTDRYKFIIEKNDKLVFDHALVITAGIERLKTR